jgi:hypothetical protein
VEAGGLQQARRQLGAPPCAGRDCGSSSTGGRAEGGGDAASFSPLPFRRRRALHQLPIRGLRSTPLLRSGAPWRRHWCCRQAPVPDVSGRAGGGWDSAHREGGPTPRGCGCVPWMDARNGGSGRERDSSVSFLVARCGDFDGKSELEAAYRSGSVPQCGQSEAGRTRPTLKIIP